MKHTSLRKALSFCLLLALLAGLAACSPAPRRAESYTNPAGDVTILENDRESCTRACNAEFDRCGETAAAGETVGRSGQFTGILGAGAECKDALKSCLNRCRAR